MIHLFAKRNLKTLTKLARHFKSIFQQSRNPKTNHLHTLILMGNDVAGLRQLTEVEKKDLKGKKSEWNKSVESEKVD